MDFPEKPTKTMAVFGKPGSGRRTFVGFLLYMRGVDLKARQQIETEACPFSWNRRYAYIVSYFDQHNLAKSFYSQSCIISIDDTTTSPDIAIWVVDVKGIDQGASSSSRLKSLIAQNKIEPKEKLIILINQMDRLGHWEVNDFYNVKGHFQDIEAGQAKTYIIPTSTLRGCNLLDMSELDPRYPKPTVMQAIG